MRKLVRLAFALTLLVSFNNATAQNYCEYQFGFAWCGQTWAIDDVTIGAFSEQNSGCNTGPYNNNTATTIALQKGAAVPFTLATGGDPVQWAIWIDLDDNGSFTDAVDLFWNTTSAVSSVSSSFVIPPSATAVNTRIRIASRNQSLAVLKGDACNFGFQAETQDFALTLSAPGGCSVPVNLAAAPAVTSALLSWDSVGTQYNVEYGQAGFILGNGTTLNPTTDTVTVSGLTANTTYDFYVQNDCSASTQDSSSWNGPFPFTTACVEISAFPNTEGFQDTIQWIPNTGFQQVNDMISNCWDRNPDGGFGYEWKMRDGSTPSSQTGPLAGYGGSGTYAHIEPGGVVGDEATFTSPLYDITSLTSPYLSFYYHMYGSDMGNLYVDVTTNGGATWTTLDSIIGQQQTSEVAGWLERGLDVSTYSSTSFQYRLRSKKTNNGFRADMAIDEIRVGEAPQCPKVSNFAISNITSSSADLNWNSANPTFFIEYGALGFTQGTGVIDTISGNTHALTNLASDTWWDVYIQTDCSVAGNGQSAWSGPYTFRSLLAPAWFEDFDANGFVPNIRWTEAVGAIANPTTFTSTFSGWGEDGWLNNGFTGAVRANISAFSTRDEWFFTDQIDLGTGNSWELYFDAAITAGSASTPGMLEADDSVHVVISTDGGITWNQSDIIFTIDQSNNLSNVGQTFVVDLSNYSGVIKLGFYLQSTVSNTNSLDFFIDNMGIRVPAACPAPTAVNASNIAESSLLLNWTAALPGNFYIEYGQKGFVQGTGTIISGITTDSSAVTGLMPVTEYDFYVHALCGVDTSAGAMVTVLTGCPGTFNTPYATDFDVLTQGNPPISGNWDNCWVSNNATGFNYRWQTGNGASTWASTGPDADHTTGMAGDGIYMYTEASNTGIDATLTNGPFDLSQLTSPTLTFWYHMFGQDMGELHVDISKDNATWDLSVYSLVGQQHSAGSDPWLRAKLALSQYSSDTVYIRFRGIKGGGSQGDMAIDDVAISESTGCIAPTGLNAINQTTTSAELVWGSYASTHSIEWGPVGFTQGTGSGTIVNNISGSSYLLTGLSTATAYDFYVQDSCNSSNWVGPKTFFTACTGPYSGTLTVGASGTFSTLDVALESLKNCGVSGPTILSLQGVNDTLNYTFNANEIPGLSATNNLTISGSGDTLISQGSEYLFNLNGAAYISFKNLSLINYPGNFVFWLHNDAHHISIEDCFLYGFNASSPNFSSAVIAATAIPTSATSSGNNANHITITGNVINGGYSGISAYGVTNSRMHNYIIEDNTFLNPYNYGVRFNNVDSIAVAKNSVSGLLSPSNGYGVYIANNIDFSITENNLIATGSALYISNANIGGVTNTSIIGNNMCVSTSSGTGIYINSANKVDIFHNSVNANLKAFRIGGFSGNGDDLDIRNNIFSSNLEEAFYNSAPGTNITYDYNVYHTNGGSNLADDGGSQYTSLTAWQTGVSSENVNSIENNPGFASLTDLHIISSVPNDVGDNTVGVLVDIDGDTRPAVGSTTVDIGADEYTPKNNDAASIGFFEPVIGCGDSAIAVSVVIRNLGINTLTSVPITVNVTGDVTTTLNTTYTGSLPQLAYDTVNVGTINAYGGAQSVSFEAITALANDDDASNDTSSVGPIFFIPVEPSAVELDTVCNDPSGTVTLEADVYNGVYYAWYANQNDTVATAIGDTFTVPISGQKDWYLGYDEEITDSLQSMQFASQFGGDGGVMFNLTAKTNLVIDSLAIHSKTNIGNVEDLIVYYIPFGSYVNNANNQSAWILLDTISYTGVGAGVPVNIQLPNTLSIPSGATYAIYLAYNAYWETGNPANMTVNTPFMRYEGGVGFWNGPFSSITNNRIFDGKIYAHNVVCSNTRTLVSIPLYADTAVASFNTVVSQPNKVDVDASASTGDLIEWNFGDGNTATGATSTHVYTNGGQYTILCTVTDTVCNTVDTATFIVNMTIGIDEDALANAVEIYPNPSNGVFNLRFAGDASEATVTVVDLVGKVISTTSLSEITSGTDQKIDLSEEPGGLYFIRIEVDGATAVKKVTKL